MAAVSAIEWTDATVNFWWGCTKVGPGCDHCYAETHSNRFQPGLWGTGTPRRKIKGAAKLLNRLDNDYAWWAADAEIGRFHPNSRRRVFIQSMSDLFDLEVPLEWFAEAWGKIVQCNRIDIQIVTKRISAVEKRLAAIGVTTWPKHAGLIVTVVNQAEADRDIPRLLALKATLGIPWVGVSAEPLLGPIDFEPWLAWPHLDVEVNGRSWGCQGCDSDCPSCPKGKAHYDYEEGPADQDGMPEWIAERRATLEWIIVGGESGKDARPLHPEWARSIRDQCAASGTAFFFKQWGEWQPREWCRDGGTHALNRWPGHSFQKIQSSPDSIERVGAGPDWQAFAKVGKKAAGHFLDGAEHRAWPKASR
ncbi:DUF5131 family protein [Bosea sp. ASV33]|uniref:DUF5131 family protein n=1 Tax=Bosea sp. ASV33 TaxID=2795106 RepID=UPI0018EB80E8|nr:DUF5131 family protein [Bosea sp. ASV33]